MAKKNKNTGHQNDKIRAAQCKNEFFRKLKYIIDGTCGKHIYPLIPQIALDETYPNRCAPFKVVADPQSRIPSRELDDSRVVLRNLIHTDIVTFWNTDVKVSLSEYYSVFMSTIFLRVRLNHDFPQAQIVRDALDTLLKNEESNVIVHERLHLLLYSHNWMNSDIRKILYWYNHELVLPKSIPKLAENIITIYSVVPPTITAKVDGNARPAIRVGWAFPSSGPIWLSLKPSDLGIKSTFADIPMEIYIQTHALNRLSERIDCFATGIVQFNLYWSLIKPIVKYNANNEVLIEYSFFQNKAGYLRADIVNGIILLRTFLFITNTGTPEGLKIEKNTGLQLLDKKYLEIDKLSTFMNSDLGTNETAKKILVDCGCQSLIDLYYNSKTILTKKDNGIHFDSMLSYMDVDKSSVSMPEAECVAETV